MQKAFKVLMATFLVSFGPAVFAQCVQAPLILGQGYQGGSPCWGGSAQYQPQLGYSNQPFVQQQQVVTQQQLPPGCYRVKKSLWDRVKDGAGEGLLTGVVGGLIGAAVDRDRGTGGRFTEVGLSAGAAVGLASTLSDNTTVVCPVPSPQQVVTQQPSQKEDISSSGCDVRVEGRLVKDLPEKRETTCESRRKNFVTLYMDRCHGKTGSLQGDIVCGQKLDI
jgi:hypothetical protein